MRKRVRVPARKKARKKAGQKPGKEIKFEPGSADRTLPTVIGPIVGPAVTADRPILTRHPERDVETPQWQAPKPVPRRLNDLPEAQSFVAPGAQGLFANWPAKIPGESPAELAPYVRYNSPDTPPNPALYNLDQIVVKFVDGLSVRLDGGKLVVGTEQKDPANVDRLRRAGVKVGTVSRYVAAFNSLVKGSGAATGSAAPQVDPEILATLHGTRSAGPASRCRIPTSSTSSTPSTPNPKRPRSC